jgi:hypothetical protein
MRSGPRSSLSFPSRCEDPKEGVFKNMWRAFLSDLDHRGILDWDEVFVDASFFPAKKGARESGKPSGERDRSAWYWSMARVFLSEFIPTLGSLQEAIYR